MARPDRLDHAGIANVIVALMGGWALWYLDRDWLLVFATVGPHIGVLLGITWGMGVLVGDTVRASFRVIIEALRSDTSPPEGGT